MQNKEIDEAKERLKYINMAYDCYNYYSRYDLDCIETLLQYIDQLENKVKELGKGQHTLMQSRRNSKTVQLAMIIYEEIKKLPDCKLFGIKNCKGKAVLLTVKECIPKQTIEDKIAELDKEEKELQDSISDEEREEYSDANISYALSYIEAKRETLQELLEGK